MSENEVLEIYTNSVVVQTGLYEVVLKLYRKTPASDEEGPGEEIARIRMSPQLAKVLNLILKKQLDAYGEQFEDIFLPDELLNRLGGGKVEEEET